MKKMRKNVYLCCGYNTVSLGTGRPEFHPKKPRPGIEHYVQEAGRKVLAQIPSADLVDECVIGNFMAARFCRQGHLAGLMASIDPALLYKPSTRTEGACCSGGLALYTAIKSILAETADVVLTLGVEVQNSMKAIYGADVLAGAGWYAGDRKKGHAYFFPNQFSIRSGVCYEKYGYDKVRRGMAHWFANAITNARRCPTAQEHHNKVEDLVELGMTPPNPKVFCEHISVFDCSKVSDAGSGLITCSEEGLKKLGIPKEQAVLVEGVGQTEADLCAPPPDQTALTNMAKSVAAAYEMAGVGPQDLAFGEVHDCFSINGLLACEAMQLVKQGEAADFVAEGNVRHDGTIPLNTSGGLIGWGHPTGGTGVRQAVDMVLQLTGKAGTFQVEVKPERPHGLLINMGGNDITVTTLIARRAE